jgi:hypothetical protein
MTKSAANPRVRDPLSNLTDILVPSPQATFLFRDGEDAEDSGGIGRPPRRILVVDRSRPATPGADAILERDGALVRGKVSDDAEEELVWGVVTWELIRRS